MKYRIKRTISLLVSSLMIYSLIACAAPSQPALAQEATSMEAASPQAAASPRAAGEPTNQVFLPVVTMASGLATPEPPKSNPYTNIIFLHHSVGHDLIDNGGLREKFSNLGYEFWDHDYNDEGLRKPTSSAPFYQDTGSNYNIPGDNTDVLPGLSDLFSQPLLTSGVPDLPGNCSISGHENDKAFTCLMRHQVIIFKSCYPNAQIDSDAKLEQYKQVYRAIAARSDQYPDHIFITLGFPPQNSHDGSRPTAADAKRARDFTNWLATSPEISGSAHPNFFVYNLFDELAGTDNFLKPEYYSSASDSHPNALADQTIAPDLVQFVDSAIKAYPAQP